MKRTRKITYAAASAAIGTASVLICAYTPINFVPLVFLSAAVYVALVKTGAWGILSALVALAASFFAVGFRDTFLLALVLFIPYAFIAFFMRKFTYSWIWNKNSAESSEDSSDENPNENPNAKSKSGKNGLKSTVIRAVVMLAFFVAEGFAMIMLAQWLTAVDITAVIGKVGSWAIYVLFAVFSLPTDFFFVFATDKLLLVLDKTGGNS